MKQIETFNLDLERLGRADGGTMHMEQTGRDGANGGRTLAARAYTLIHEAILKGQFRPGSRLRIEELVEIFQISPTPIREALNRLESTGLIESIPHRGARVADLSLVDLMQLWEARLALEPLAVGKAAGRFTLKMAELARACLLRLHTAEENNDFLAAWTAHTDFHYVLYESGCSRWLVRLITPVWESSERYRVELTCLRADLMRRTCEHESLLQACINHQVSRAVDEMHNHLERTGNEIADLLKKSDQLE